MIKITFTKFLASFATGAILLAGAIPALALSPGADGSIRASAKTSKVGTTTIKAGVNLEARIAKAKSRADQEIERRIEALTRLTARIQSMSRVSENVKTQMAAAVTAEISSLTALKAKIAADADIDALKIDIKSISQSYRIFALIIPAGHIAATADKIKSTADMMAAVGVKLQTRIAAAKTAGKEVSALETTLADFNAKLTDAKAQADAALSITAALQPDQGEAQFQANKKALMDARLKLKAGREDLKAARRDAGEIVQSLKSMMKMEVKGELKGETRGNASSTKSESESDESR